MVFICWTVYTTVQERKEKKKETGKEDKYAKIVVEFIWFSEYTTENLVDEQATFSTALEHIQTYLKFVYSCIGKTIIF